MSDARRDWLKAKADAAKLNGGKEVKLKADSGLGPALDAYVKAEEKSDSVDQKSVSDAEWVKAKKTWIKAATDAVKIIKNYQTELDGLKAKGAISAPVYKRLNDDGLKNIMNDHIYAATKNMDVVRKKIARLGG